MYLIEWKHFFRQFLFSVGRFFFFLFFPSVCSFVFLSHLEIIRCFVKSLIATSTYFFMKCNWKKETFLGARVWMTKPICRSPEWPGYVTDRSENFYDKNNSFKVTLTKILKCLGSNISCFLSSGNSYMNMHSYFSFFVI